MLREEVDAVRRAFFEASGHVPLQQPRVVSVSAQRLPQVVAPAELAFSWQSVAVAWMGPAALGACVGLKSSVGAMLGMGLALPCLLALVGAMTLPGFYVASALCGTSPRMSQMARIALGGARDLGIVMLGLTPALVLVIATLATSDEALVVASLTAWLAGMLGARALFHRLTDSYQDWRILAIFGVWLLVSAGLSWELYVMALHMSGGL